LSVQKEWRRRSPDSTDRKWDYSAMPRDARTVVKYVIAGLALAALLALAPFFFASGLMAPGWAVGVFIGAWLLLFGLGCFWIRRKPLWVVPLPFVAAAIWFGGMNAGAAWLGWTA
jgi:membrane-bound ClpP family serine protease